MEKGKMQKKVMAAFLVLAMVLGAAPIGVRADHLIPGDLEGRRCNNTYRTYMHTGYQTSMFGGSHPTSDGAGCVMTVLFYKHAVACTSCGFVVSRPTYSCTTEHSRCGSRTVNHTGY